mmetsp:Transcript_12766/g.20922  ORF Transcript_12766/g.20922 Transcript_12766/m.20922 type:complete len:466 (+) Transcript_12766:149-1546(+)
MTSYSQDLIIGNKLMSQYELMDKQRKRRHWYSLYWRPYDITDLAIEPLTHVASFLTPPSRALFAIALYGSREHRSERLCKIPNRHSCYWWDHSRRHSIRALMGNECENLDFGDVEKSLAVKINDCHLVMILFCFDVVNKIKKIRLTHCIQINGTGLWPLRGALVVEQIDLSIVTKHKSPKLWKELQNRRKRRYNPWQNHAVVRTLEGIIAQEGNALKHLQLHWSWREYWEPPQPLDFLIIRYNNMLESRGNVSCSKCTVNLPARAVRIDNSNNFLTRIRAAQHHTCSTCLRNYCDACITENNEMKILEYCYDCEEFQCQDCRKKENCERCDRKFCVETCGALKECFGCPDKVCSRCSFESTCVRCNTVECGQCRDPVRECSICLRHWCRDCLPTTLCDHCDDFDMLICGECISERKCDQCDYSFCGNCRSISECKLCKQRCCSDCDPSRAWGRDGRNGYCAECAN